MENEPNKIDDLFRESLKGYEPEPSRKVWRGIGIMLALGEFLRFSFTNFSQNIFQLLVAGGAATAVVVGAVTIFTPDKPKETKQSIVNKPTTEVPHQNPDINKQRQAIENVATIEPKRRLVNYQQINDKQEQKQTVLPEPMVVDMVVPVAPARTNINSIRAIGVSGFPLGFGNPSTTKNMADYAPFLRNQLSKYQEAYVPKTSFSITAGYGVDQLTIAKANESVNFLYNTADLGFRIQKGRVYLQTGLSASYQFDNGLYSVSSKSYDSVGFYYNVHYYVPDPSHPESVILVTSKVTLYDTITHHASVQTTNKYLNIQIPLIVGYKVADFKRFSFYAFGGPIIQFTANKKEPALTYIASDLYPAQISNQSPIRLDTYWQLTGGLRASVILTKRFSLEVEPSYKWYFTNLYKDANYNNPFSVGLRAGVSFSF
jgi:hypothetical protein